ncbi:MAG: hypothetical protein ACHQX1_00485 [Candidatus Micrarchaeales archaeon]
MAEPENENEYERLVALIGEIEVSSKKEDVAYIDISDMVNKTQLTPQKSYKELLDIINDVESGGRKSREVQQERAHEQAMPQPAQQLVAPKMQKQQKQERQKAQKMQQIPEQQESGPQRLITSGVAQTQFTQVNVVQPAQKEKKKQFNLFQPKPQSAPPTPAEAAEDRKKNVVNELGSIANKLTSSKPSLPELKRRKVNMKDLVLPNLSIADQISELERIIEGLKEHVFDSDHIDIVVQEVYGLQQAANEAKKKQKGKMSEMSNLERSLWELRDERLQEATALLLQSGAS